MSLQITHIQGGMREFERTGIYPDYLLFNLSCTRQSWKVRIKKTPQEGVLKIKGKVLYEYNFDGYSCNFRKLENDGSFTTWMVPECLIIEMRD